ncbi:unnamed protein product [Leuciscus chuanchicus]
MPPPASPATPAPPDSQHACHKPKHISTSKLLHLLNTKILAVEDEDTDLTKTTKSKILNYINKHHKDETTQEHLDIATSLDPRFKTSYTDEDKLPNIKARVMSDMKMSSHKEVLRKLLQKDINHASSSAT